MRKKLSPKFSIKKAHELQLQLSKKLIFKDTLPDIVKYVAGVDIAYLGELSIGVAAVLDFSTMSLVEFQVARLKTGIPYVPTLLSFREIPPAYSAIKKLHVKPDVFLVDGQGFAHPYGLGFASHLGLILDKPTVGVAKSILCGNVELTNNNDQFAPLTDDGKVIGAELVTKYGTKPVYVSVGHKVSLERAIMLVMACVGKYRLPEPIRNAHIIANSEKRKLETLV